MTFRILHVEDSTAEVELIAEAFEELGADLEISNAVTGADAIAWLLREGKYASKATPDLVLLDLNLPQKNGREVLAVVKADPVLRAVPVVILTTSCSNDDVRACYALGANAYVAKPIGFDAVRRSVAAIHSFWIESNIRPLFEA